MITPKIFMIQNQLQFSSIYIKWEDKRYIDGNEDRNISCKSKQVDWTTEGQFWLPKLKVEGILESVRFY